MNINAVYFSTDALLQSLLKHFSNESCTHQLNEITLTLNSDLYVQHCLILRNVYGFDTLIDLCAVDYSAYRENTESPYTGKRYAIVLHLLSVKNNVRLRVRTYINDDNFPILDSIVSVWACASWYEREAFDLMGIVFKGHPDLRRILTDYGFIGHPLRKDFPVSGHIEMRYDEINKRIIYQPITIEPRENTPRVIRESGYARP